MHQLTVHDIAVCRPQTSHFSAMTTNRQLGLVEPYSADRDLFRHGLASAVPPASNPENSVETSYRLVLTGASAYGSIPITTSFTARQHRRSPLSSFRVRETP